MSPSLYPYISLFVVVIFFGLMLITKKDKNKLYVQYILIAFPIIQCSITFQQLNFTGFDFVSYIFLLTLYKKKHVKLNGGDTYLFLLMVIVMAAIIGCSYAQSLEVDYTGRAFITIGSIFIFAKIVIEECLDDPSFFYTILKCLKISLITSLIFLVGQFIFGIGFSIAIVQNPNVLSEGTRYTSYFQDPQKYAQFLAAQSILLLIVPENKKRIPFENYILFFCAVIAILFTGGRAGLGGWGVGILLVLLLSNSSYRIAAFIGGLILFFVVYSFADSFVIFQRTSVTDSYDYRYEIWTEALEIFRNHPFFGIGLGNYHNYVSVHYPDQIWSIDPLSGEPSYFDHPESGYLKFLTELGAAGFVPIVLFLLMPIFKGFGLFFKTRDTSIVFLIAALVSWMVGFYTVYSLSDVRIEVFIIAIYALLITRYKRFTSEYNAEQVIYAALEQA